MFISDVSLCPRHTFLHTWHLADIPEYQCSSREETWKHVLWECPLYDDLGKLDGLVVVQCLSLDICAPLAIWFDRLNMFSKELRKHGSPIVIGIRYINWLLQVHDSPNVEIFYITVVLIMDQFCKVVVESSPLQIVPVKLWDIGWCHNERGGGSRSLFRYRFCLWFSGSCTCGSEDLHWSTNRKVFLDL